MTIRKQTFSVRPSRPAIRPGHPTSLKSSSLADQIRDIFRERQGWGRPADSVHNRVYGPKIGGTQ